MRVFACGDIRQLVLLGYVVVLIYVKVKSVQFLKIFVVAFSIRIVVDLLWFVGIEVLPNFRINLFSLFFPLFSGAISFYSSTHIYL